MRPLTGVAIFGSPTPLLLIGLPPFYIQATTQGPDSNICRLSDSSPSGIPNAGQGANGFWRSPFVVAVLHTLDFEA